MDCGPVAHCYGGINVKGVKIVYIVKWCNNEGNLENRSFERLEDAKMEAADLLNKYGWSEIVDKLGFHW